MPQLSDEEVARLDAWWRAANYVSVGQIYLLDNPLLRRPLEREDIKPRLLGHWGTTPGLNLLWTHLNRLIRERDVNAIFLAGPGHGGPAAVANAWLEGTYSEIYPHIGPDGVGMQRLFRQFSFPGGIPSHVAPETPGLHPRGRRARLRALARVRRGDGQPRPGRRRCRGGRRVRDRPAGRVVAREQVRRPGPRRCGAPDPAPQRLQDRQPLGARPDPAGGAREPAAWLRPRGAHGRGRRARGCAPAAGRPRSTRPTTRSARSSARPARTATSYDGPGRWSSSSRPRAGPDPPWWTGSRSKGPGAPTRSRWQRPARTTHTGRSSRIGCGPTGPRSSSTTTAGCVASLRALAPEGDRRMSANPHANGGRLRRPLSLPDFRDHAVEVSAPGASVHEPTRVLGRYLVDVVRDNPDNFRIFGPDETASNRLDAVYEVTDKVFAGEILPVDEHLAPSGRVMEILSEHTCQGWLEGYLLTGRHGLFSCYEAFIHIVDSMLNQHAKWLKTTRELEWRPRIASLNYLLSSARVAAGPQRLLAPGPRVHRPRGEQEGGGGPGLPAAGHQHPALDDAALPGEPALRERRGGRQAAAVRLAGRRGGRPALRPRARHLGLGLATRATTPTS